MRITGINSGNTARQEKQHSGWVPTVTAGWPCLFRPSPSASPRPFPAARAPPAASTGSASARSAPAWSSPSHTVPCLSPGLVSPSVHPPRPLTRVALSAAMSAGERGSRSSSGGAVLSGRGGVWQGGRGSPGLESPGSLPRVPVGQPLARAPGEPPASSFSSSACGGARAL